MEFNNDSPDFDRGNEMAATYWPTFIRQIKGIVDTSNTGIHHSEGEVFIRDFSLVDGRPGWPAMEARAAYQDDQDGDGLYCVETLEVVTVSPKPVERYVKVARYTLASGDLSTAEFVRTERVGTNGWFEPVTELSIEQVEATYRDFTSADGVIVQRIVEKCGVQLPTE